jgi:hypothetical protein
VGCGFRASTTSVYFTKNGEQVGDDLSIDVSKPLFPTITSKANATVKIVSPSPLTDMSLVYSSYVPPTASKNVLAFKHAHNALERELQLGRGVWSETQRLMSELIEGQLRALFTAAAEEAKASGDIAQFLAAMFKHINREQSPMYSSVLSFILADIEYLKVQTLFNDISNQVTALSKGQPARQDEKACKVADTYAAAMTVLDAYRQLVSLVAAKVDAWGFTDVAPLKGLVRLIEKRVLSRDENCVLDVVRGILIFRSLGAMFMALSLFAACDARLNQGGAGIDRGIRAEFLVAAQSLPFRIELVKVKNRHDNPTSMQWADVILIFRIVGLPGHLMEIQLVHKDMYLVRDRMDGHHKYNQARAAAEQLEYAGRSDLLAYANETHATTHREISTDRGDSGAVAQQMKQMMMAMQQMQGKMAQQEAEMAQQKAKAAQQEAKAAQQEAEIAQQKAKIAALEAAKSGGSVGMKLLNQINRSLGPLDVAKCKVAGDGIKVASAGVEAKLTIFTQRNPRSPGNDVFAVSLKSMPDRGEPSLPGVEITDTRQGSHTVTYTAPSPGVYSLAVTHEGKHLTGSPFTVQVN